MGMLEYIQMSPGAFLGVMDSVRYSTDRTWEFGSPRKSKKMSTLFS